MSESVFNGFVDNYDDACERGLSLSGENRDFFLRERLKFTCELSAGARVNRILDFGCGVGHSTPYLLQMFPQAAIVGLDTSDLAIQSAQQRYGSDRARFVTGGLERSCFDLVYSNGTFHHIEPRLRPGVVQDIFASMAPGSRFMLWENNPWNPGTRLIMKRIPFDRDAQTLTYREAASLVRSAGFVVETVYFYFYFPSFLKGLRRFEGALRSIPLGAQYCVIGRKPV